MIKFEVRGEYDVIEGDIVDEILGIHRDDF